MDFGNHPGKDRMPREAAIMKCCVITSKKGSAGFYDDVPISGEYKFDCVPENYEAVRAKIMQCFERFEEKLEDFAEYREIIKSEEAKFTAQVREIFCTRHDQGE